MKNVPASLERGVPETSHYSYKFRLFSLQLKDIHKNYYPSISDYFLSNLTTKRKILGVGVSCPQERERERERERGGIFSLICQ